jgi:hypothetical protein
MDTPSAYLKKLSLAIKLFNFFLSKKCDENDDDLSFSCYSSLTTEELSKNVIRKRNSFIFGQFSDSFPTSFF